MTTSNLIHLIYISSATSWPTAEDLVSLLDQARARNLRQNITGMLIYTNATYMQVLEGSRHDVHDIFDAICKDTRNNGVVKLLDEDIVHRDFPQWSMGFKELGSAGAGGVNPPGYVEVFNGKLDRALALGNRSDAIRMLMSFARQGLDPSP